MFLVDTDHITVLQWKAEPEYSRIQHRAHLHPATAFYYSLVSFHEQTRGAHAYVNQARTSQEAVKGYSFFERILTDFSGRQVLIFDGIAAAAFDLLRTQKPRIGTMDLRIAAIALSRNMTLLTRNLRDFQRVPGLKVEDWTV